MKETNYQYSLSRSDDIAPIGNREILGKDARVQKDDGKYTDLGIDANTSYNSRAAEAAADSYIASRYTKTNHKKNKAMHKSKHINIPMLILLFVIFPAFIIIGVLLDDSADPSTVDNGAEPTAILVSDKSTDDIIIAVVPALIAGAIGLVIAKKKNSPKIQEIVLTGCAAYLLVNLLSPLFGVVAIGIYLVLRKIIK